MWGLKQDFAKAMGLGFVLLDFLRGFWCVH